MSRSGAGDADADVSAELDDAYPERLSLLSGVAGRPAVDAGESPADFLNICRREILPLSRPGVDEVEAEGSASVPADRGLREDENEGRPDDLICWWLDWLCGELCMYGAGSNMCGSEGRLG